MTTTPIPGAAPSAYVARNDDATWDAFVRGTGFLANARLVDALAYVRKWTGRTHGAVACWDRDRGKWDSEFELSLESLTIQPVREATS